MIKPSEAELEILQVLWKLQPCTVRDIHDVLSMSKEVGYTTTLKQVQRMEDKGLLVREGKTEGKSILYRAVQTAIDTKTRLVDRMVKNVFENSVSELMMHALGKEKISEDEIKRIKEILAKLENKGK